MQTVNIHEAKTHLLRFVDRAAAGEEILVAGSGKTVARLVALASDMNKSRALSLGTGRFTLPASFDHLHAEAIQSMFEAGE
jgi:antitoxin (DNA-binding transcriptional repressor) of toxin-antitoxin stability system